MTRHLVPVLCLLCCGLAVSRAGAQSSAHSPPDSVLLVGATVHMASGEALQNASVLVRGGRVVKAAVGLAAPAGVPVVDASGKVLTAGLVAVGEPLGLLEISLEEVTRDSGHEHDADPVRASFGAADGFNPRSSLIPVARSGGITAAVTAPSGGLVSGTSALVELGALPDAMLVAEQVALHVDLGPSGLQAAKGARPAALGQLRRILDDARLYAKGRARFDRRGLRPLSVSRLDLERLSQALRGKLPVVVRVARASDILRVLDLAREYGLRLILSGAEEGWLVADRIAAAKVPVVVVPLTNLPTSFAALGSRMDNAALLHAAGVQLVLAQPGAHDLRNLRQQAGNAVAWGLPWGDALLAITEAPARVFDLGDDYGAIQAGRRANLVLWSGDPLELSSRPERMWVEGREVDLRSRQSALLERYRHTAPAAAGSH